MSDGLTTARAVGALLFGIAAAVLPRMGTAEVLSRAAKGTIVQEAPARDPVKQCPLLKLRNTLLFTTQCIAIVN
jgi:hypothetical protein